MKSSRAEKTRTVLLTAILFMLITGGIFSDAGTIKGIVKDGEGNPVENALVRAVSEDDSVSEPASVLTNRNGEFIIEVVVGGVYTLIVEDSLGTRSIDVNVNTGILGSFGCNEVETVISLGQGSWYWQWIGEFLDVGYTIPSLAVNTSGNPVVAWDDDSSGNSEIYLKQWNGTDWVEMGDGSASGAGISDTSGGSYCPSLAIDDSGKMIVAWAEHKLVSNYEIYVKQWNGTNWVAISTGSATGGGISNNSGWSDNPSVVINNAGNPIVAWGDTPSGYTDAIYLKQWNGTTWEELDDSASVTGLGYGENPSMAINGLGNPIVVWSGGHSIYLKQWNGTTWEELDGSGSGFGIGNGENPSMAINGSGYPVVAWESYTTENGEVYLKQWNGSNWEELGGSATGGGISNDSNGSTKVSLAINTSGNPIVAWESIEESNWNRHQIYVERWNGSEWVELAGNNHDGLDFEAPNASTSGSLSRPSITVNEYGKMTVAWEGSDDIRIVQWNGN